MESRCPLCRSGALTPSRREIRYGETLIGIDVSFCSGCREVVLDGSQVELFRAAIRQAGLATSEDEVERVMEQALLEPE